MADDDETTARREAQIKEAHHRATLLLAWCEAQHWDPHAMDMKITFLMIFCSLAFTGNGRDLTTLLRFLCDAWDECATNTRGAMLEAVVAMMHKRAQAAAAADDEEPDDDQDDDDDQLH